MQVGWLREEGRVCSCRWVGWGRRGGRWVGWGRGCHMLGWEVGRGVGVAAALVLCVKVLLPLSDTNCV